MSIESIGETIRKTRIEKGLTQKEVAERCGMADSAIRKYESGKVCPKIETLKRIAEALGVDPYSLVDFDTATEMLVESMNSVEDSRQRITTAYEKLTSEGQAKAAEIVEIIAGNPLYQRQEIDMFEEGILNEMRPENP